MSVKGSEAPRPSANAVQTTASERASRQRQRSGLGRNIDAPCAGCQNYSDELRSPDAAKLARGKSAILGIARVNSQPAKMAGASYANARPRNCLEIGRGGGCGRGPDRDERGAESRARAGAVGARFDTAADRTAPRARRRPIRAVDADRAEDRAAGLLLCFHPPPMHLPASMDAGGGAALPGDRATPGRCDGHALDPARSQGERAQAGGGAAHRARRLVGTRLCRPAGSLFPTKPAAFSACSPSICRNGMGAGST